MRLGVGLIAATLVAGCGGGSKRAVVTVTVPQPEFTSPTATSPSASSKDLRVEHTKIVYLSEQTGGNFHEVVVLLRNDADLPAIDVTGQISIYDGDKLVKTIEPSRVTVLAHSRNAWVEDVVELPKPLPNGRVVAYIAPVQFAAAGSPIVFSRVRYNAAGPDDFGRCSVTGIIKNHLRNRKGSFAS